MNLLQEGSSGSNSDGIIGSSGGISDRLVEEAKSLSHWRIHGPLDLFAVFNLPESLR